MKFSAPIYIFSNALYVIANINGVRKSNLVTDPIKLRANSSNEVTALDTSIVNYRISYFYKSLYSQFCYSFLK